MNVLIRAFIFFIENFVINNVSIAAVIIIRVVYPRKFESLLLTFGPTMALLLAMWIIIIMRKGATMPCIIAVKNNAWIGLMPVYVINNPTKAETIITV